MIDSMDKEISSMKKELLKICWHMRGGMSYNEASLLSPDERSLISELIKENYEITKESHLPHF